MMSFKRYQVVNLFLADVNAMPSSILKGNGYFVQHFSYDSKREHNYVQGSTYHIEDATIIDVTLRLNTSDAPKSFMEQIKDPGLQAYSFIFNPTYTKFGRLESMDDAMVVRGYIVDVEEEYKLVSGKEEQEQMLMHVKLLANQILFLGKTKERYLELKV